MGHNKHMSRNVDAKRGNGHASVPLGRYAVLAQQSRGTTLPTVRLEVAQPQGSPSGDELDARLRDSAQRGRRARRSHKATARELQKLKEKQAKENKAKEAAEALKKQQKRHARIDGNAIPEPTFSPSEPVLRDQKEVGDEKKKKKKKKAKGEAKVALPNGRRDVTVPAHRRGEVARAIRHARVADRTGDPADMSHEAIPPLISRERTRGRGRRWLRSVA